MSKLEKIQRVVIVVLVTIIVIGLSYFGSELKHLKNGTDSEAKPYYNYINIEEYKEIMSLKSATKIVYLGRNDCGYCEQQNPIVEELMEEYNLKINYLELSEVDSKEAEYLYDSYEPFEDDGVRTPTILIVKNKKVVDASVGLADKETLVKLFTKYELIEE